MADSYGSSSHLPLFGPDRPKVSLFAAVILMQEISIHTPL